MIKLEIFKSYIVGNFNNQPQIERQRVQKKITHPYAEHINCIVDNKIENLPTELNGFFILGRKLLYNHSVIRRKFN